MKNIFNLQLSREWQLILLFAVIKLLIHFFTYNNFELHRDAYLYYAQGEHLSWGYVAVPPSIAFFSKIATFIFGNTLFGLRFITALIGSLNLIIIGLFVRELGGRKIAITLASLAFILSPSFLHVNALFQPVGFNQFYWLLCGYLILIMVKRNDPKMWIWIGLVFGIAFLNKYSIVFFYTAFGISLLISEYRNLFKSKYFIYGVSFGFLIILPNLLWQYQNNWPVLMHMAELRETQLVHVELSGFIVEQFLMNIQGIYLWITALLVLLLKKSEKQYRIFGFIYLIVILLLILGSGKPYYSLGLYPILFVFGAFFIEKYVPKFRVFVYSSLIMHMLISLYVAQQFDGIPLSTFETIKQKDAFRWEDGVNHDIPQDMADMTGWNDLGQTVRDIYLNLSEEDRKNCDVFSYNYGQAGAIMFHGKDIGIPQPISFNGSFIFWAPDSLIKSNIIWVHSSLNTDFEPATQFPMYFKKTELKATIDNPNFRENGTQIFLCQNPTDELKKEYKQRVEELKSSYQR